MTEFFDHLVSRSQASPGETPTGEVLRPRLPSLFEAPQGGAPAPAAIGAMERAAEGDGVQPQGEAPGTPTPRPQLIPSMAGELGPEGDGRITTKKTSEPETGRFQAGLNQDPPERRFGDAGLLRAREPGNAAARPEKVRPLPFEETGAQVREARLEAGNADGSGEQAGGPVERRLPRLEPVHPGQLPAASVPFGAAPVKGADSTATDPLEAGFQAPSVHIHVGRIEVRAVTQTTQTPPRAPAAARPKLSLDEYLRQRNEGKR